MFNSIDTLFNEFWSYVWLNKFKSCCNISIQINILGVCFCLFFFHFFKSHDKTVSPHGSPTRSETNQAVQQQKMARSLKIQAIKLFSYSTQLSMKFKLLINSEIAQIN